MKDIFFNLFYEFSIFRYKFLVKNQIDAKTRKVDVKIFKSKNSFQNSLSILTIFIHIYNLQQLIDFDEIFNIYTYNINPQNSF